LRARLAKRNAKEVPDTAKYAPRALKTCLGFQAGRRHSHARST